MQVRRFLHVAPYPDPYLFLTESPISFLDQPATRSQSHLHMGPGLVSACQALRPPPSQAPRSIIVLRSPSAMITTTVPWSPRPLSVCFFFTCQQRRRQPNRVWQSGVLLVLVGWSLTLKKSRCQRRTTSSPISPTKLSFASHRVGTFYIIILFLFCFVSCCPPPADVISFLTFLSCPLESPLSSTPLWP